MKGEVNQQNLKLNSNNNKNSNLPATKNIFQSIQWQTDIFNIIATVSKV